MTIDDMKAATESQEQVAPETPWHQQYTVPDADREILSRYKSVDEALATIGSRERHLSQTVKLPDAKKPAERAKQVRQILGRLGAYESPEMYADAARELITPDVKDVVTEDEIKEVAQKAFEEGVLPESFTGSIKSRISAIQEMAKARKEMTASANQKKLDDDATLTEVWGRNKSERLKNADAMAEHWDRVFATLNQKSFSEEELANGGGIFHRLLHSTTEPAMAIAFAETHRRLFGSAGMPGGGTAPPGAPNAWQQHYDRFMSDCAGLTNVAEEAKKYADKMSLMSGGLL